MTHNAAQDVVFRSMLFFFFFVFFFTFPLLFDVQRCSNLEVSDTVAFSQGDLENLQTGDEGSQSGQALLATAAHSDQQRVAPWRLQDSVDAAAACGGADSRGREMCEGGKPDKDNL